MPEDFQDQAKRMTDLIKQHKLARVLELGFAHGVSTCYIADAVKKMPRGSVTAIDLTASRNQLSVTVICARTG